MIDPAVEHLLNDVVYDIMEEIVARVFKKDILRGRISICADGRQKASTHDNGKQYPVVDVQLFQDIPTCHRRCRLLSVGVLHGSTG